MPEAFAALEAFLDEQSSRFERIFAVLGNHVSVFTVF